MATLSLATLFGGAAPSLAARHEDVLEDMRAAGVLPFPSQQQHIPGSSARRADALAASAARINVANKDTAAVSSAITRYARQWQTAAWDYFEAIGEVRYGLSSLAAAGGRAILLAGIHENMTKPPTTLSSIKDSDPYYGSVGPQTREALERADDYLAEVNHLLTNSILNIAVAGEFYLTELDDEWEVLSSEELVPVGSNGEIITSTRSITMSSKAPTWMIRRDRNRPPVPIKENAYLARIWRPHPRWQQEPTSSMLGILDQCEALLLLDQMIRTTIRSRLWAGTLFIPDTVTSSHETESIEEDITTAALTAIGKEDAAFGVVPLILTGPPEAGDQIKSIPIGRGIDASTLALIERLLDRILTGIDLPKEFVKGLGSAKYANAVILEEGMYRLHIAPVLELICKALTKVYVRPRLLKDGVPEAIVRRIVATFDPTNIVTRPDRGQAANDGYDRKTISAAAWRAARGFTEADAPTDSERYRRLIAEKGQMPPDTVAATVERMGGTDLAMDRRYVEQINAAAQKAEAAAQPSQPGPGSGSNQTTGPQVQPPTQPATPEVLPSELTDILPPRPEQAGGPRERNKVPGSNTRPGEMLPPRM